MEAQTKRASTSIISNGITTQIRLGRPNMTTHHEISLIPPTLFLALTAPFGAVLGPAALLPITVSVAIAPSSLVVATPISITVAVATPVPVPVSRTRAAHFYLL